MMTKASVVLTVSEGKRLIAKGVAQLPEVKRALQEGMLVIATGTTNAYVAEEILGKKISLPGYTSGLTLPDGGKADLERYERTPDIVLRDGKLVKDLDRFRATKEMGPGDVYLKGANALDYSRREAGVLIGGPGGGTVGAVIGDIVGGRIHFIIPVGLEKSIPGSLGEVAEASSENTEYLNTTPTLWVLPGKVVTEVEALEVLTGVRARPLAAGGVGGAEGSVRLLLEGDKKEVEAALLLVRSVHGEPPFLQP